MASHKSKVDSLCPNMFLIVVDAKNLFTLFCMGDIDSVTSF